jgi:hypothetical protein
MIIIIKIMLRMHDGKGRAQWLNMTENSPHPGVIDI